MKPSTTKPWLLAIAGFAAASLLTPYPAAEARPPYNKAFSSKYLGEESKMAKALEGKTSCNVCHVGENRRKRNDYGIAFGKAFKRGTGEKGIEEALEKIAKLPSKPKEKKSATFGELIEEGTLPITK